MFANLHFNNQHVQSGRQKLILKITFEHFFPHKKIQFSHFYYHKTASNVFLYYIDTVFDPSMQLDLFQIKINNPVVAEKFSVTVSVLRPPHPQLPGPSCRHVATKSTTRKLF